ncbi:MAG: SPOR domain-containing protein [Pseudomonadota bacterium]
MFDRRTGIVVGDEFPELVYPNTDLRAVAPATQAAPQATVSTKRAPVAAQAPVQAVSNRHVQVATFADMAAAQAAAQRLANTGLRTRIGKYSSGGERRQVIVLGPFSSTAETNRALKTARGMGFSSAVARK